jgi:hypothetical protein
LEISNIPLINLRFEFLTYYDAFQKENIEEVIDKNIKLLNVPFCLLPIQNKETLFTSVLQRVILGFEAFYTGAASEILIMREADLKTLRSFKQDPRRWAKDKSYCHAAFIKIPGQLNEDYRLDRRNSRLYDKVRKFYREVRNQLFHGCQFNKIKIHEFQDFLRMYEGLCDWVQLEYEVMGKSPGSPHT